MIDENAFNHLDWSPIIVESLDGIYICPNCKHKIYGNKVGEHLYCETCCRFCWKKKVRV
jgi:hypothetical protein